MGRHALFGAERPQTPLVPQLPHLHPPRRLATVMRVSCSSFYERRTLLLLALMAVGKGLLELLTAKLLTSPDMHLLFLNAYYTQNSTCFSTNDGRVHSAVVLFFADQPITPKKFPMQCVLTSLMEWPIYGRAALQPIVQHYCSIGLYRLMCPIAKVHLNNTVVRVGRGPVVRVPGRLESKWRRGVVVCMPPLRGFDAWQELLAAVEVAGLYRVDRLALYLDSVPAAVLTLLRTYEEERRVKLETAFDFARLEVPAFQRVYEWAVLVGTMNDCLYKYRNTAEFVVFSEPGSLLVPRRAPTLLQELRFLKAEKTLLAGFFVPQLRATVHRFKSDPVRTIRSIQVSFDASQAPPVKVAVGSEAWGVGPYEISHSHEITIKHKHMVSGDFILSTIHVHPNLSFALDLLEQTEPDLPASPSSTQNFQKVFNNFPFSMLEYNYRHFFFKKAVKEALLNLNHSRTTSSSQNCLREARRHIPRRGCIPSPQCRYAAKNSPCQSVTPSVKTTLLHFGIFWHSVNSSISTDYKTETRCF